MERLTKKEPYPKVPCYVDIMTENYTTKNKKLAINKLGKIEDLEEEIGCPLEALFNALKNGVYAREDDSQFYKYEMQQVRGICRNGLICISKNAPYPECDFTLLYINYKKTWWLKADKSE